MLRVFVYGTLKPGGRYHQPLCQNDLTDALPAMVRGRLYDFPQLGYPAMVPGEDWVKGFVLVFERAPIFCADILSRLDLLEGYSPHRAAEQNDYQRLRVQPASLNREPLPLAWVYQITEERAIAQGGVYLPDGEFPIEQPLDKRSL